MSAPSLIIRPSTSDDVPAIQGIYAHHVLHGTGSFEEEAPTVAEMIQRRDGLLGQGYPYLVATTTSASGEEIIVGYAYAGPFRSRPAFRYTVEDSIYISPLYQGCGAGSALLKALVQDCTDRGFRQMVALVGDSANHGSLALHRKFGFIDGGVMTSVGLKFGRWLDVVILQRPLGNGDQTIPTP